MSVNGAMVRISADELAWFRTADDQAIVEKTDNWFWSDEPRALNLAKMFVGVHFLLTGVDPSVASGEPISFLGNQAYGEELHNDFGYGPVACFRPTPSTRFIARYKSCPRRSSSSAWPIRRWPRSIRSRWAA